MDRPFNEIHEIYRILYLRSEAQKKAEEEREKEEREKEEKKNKKHPTQKSLTDVNTVPELSPLEAEAMEDALEELM